MNYIYIYILYGGGDDLAVIDESNRNSRGPHAIPCMYFIIRSVCILYAYNTRIPLQIGGFMMIKSVPGIVAAMAAGTRADVKFNDDELPVV